MRKHMESPAGLPAELQAFWNGASLTSTVDSYNAWLANLGRVQDESVRFLRTRMSVDLQAASDMAACKTPTEMLDRQIEYVGAAFSAFMDESKKMLALCQSTVTTPRPGHKPS